MRLVTFRAGALGALSLLGTAAGAQTAGMTQAQARQLYAAGGFPISADGRNPTNRCGRAANPRITFVDMNGDGRKEAVFVDTGSCYQMDARWYAVATQDAAGNWRRILDGPGSMQAVGTVANGWFVLNVTGGGKIQTMVYNGQSYVPRAAGASPAPASPGQTAPAASAAGRAAGTAAAPAAPAPTAAPAPASAAAQGSAARDAAIFRAAGFKQIRDRWESGCYDPDSGSYYEPGTIDTVKDLNGDGRPEAIVTEGTTYCYGMTGQGFWLVSEQADGNWKLLYNAPGIPEFLSTKGAGGWPDISVGGPGFCFPVVRWNGSAYVQHRMEYEGKPCR